MPLNPIIPLEEDVVEEKRKKLGKVLEDLSHMMDNDGLDHIAHELESIYDREYRQLYSELYPRLVRIRDGPEGDLDLLLDNLEAIRTMVRDDYLKGGRRYRDYLFGSVLKLSDHINLEWQRMIQNKDLDDRTKESMKMIDALEKKATKAMRKARNLQLEVVAILAIFAAIVVAFAGGLNLMSGSMSGIGQTDLLSLLSVLSLCGIVLFNTIAFLMHAVIWIVRRQNDILSMGTKTFGREEGDESRFVDPAYIIMANIILVAIFCATTYLAL